MKSATNSLITVFYIVLAPLTGFANTGDMCYPDQAPFNDTCKDVAKLEWNNENSKDNIPDNSKRVISVTGGQGPYTWTITGNGFFLDENRTTKKETTEASNITIYTKDACGPASVQIKDSCNNSTEGFLRSIDGKWVLISQTPCEVSISGCGTAVRGSNYCVSGKYLIHEFWSKDGVNCTYPWLGTCSSSQVQEARKWTCTYNIWNYSESCGGFSPPQGYVRCNDQVPKYTKWDGYQAVLETGNVTSDFRAWEWRCQN